MNSTVNRWIRGLRVIATPVLRSQGGCLGPAYWTGEVNDRVLPQTFSSAVAVFDYVAQQGVGSAGGR